MITFTVYIISVIVVLGLLLCLMPLPDYNRAAYLMFYGVSILFAPALLIAMTIVALLYLVLLFLDYVLSVGE